MRPAYGGAAMTSTTSTELAVVVNGPLPWDSARRSETEGDRLCPATRTDNLTKIWRKKNVRP
jgi:hypothetical protein